ncbi:hypothetical protein YQE_06101, partial [Dendroctonus ponderosae]
MPLNICLKIILPFKINVILYQRYFCIPNNNLENTCLLITNPELSRKFHSKLLAKAAESAQINRYVLSGRQDAADV